MRLQSTLLVLALLSSPMLAQAHLEWPGKAPADTSPTLPCYPSANELQAAQAGPLTSNRNFPNFIGFISNPVQNNDPRSLTQICPIVGSAWTSASPPRKIARGSSRRRAS